VLARRALFGHDFSVPTFTCPYCGELIVTATFQEPVSHREDPADESGLAHYAVIGAGRLLHRCPIPEKSIRSSIRRARKSRGDSDPTREQRNRETSS
jgi:hypothetical protein